MLRLDIDAGVAERDGALLKIVGQGRYPHKIPRGIAAMALGGETAGLVPFVARVIAAPDPDQRDQVDYLVLVKARDGVAQFRFGCIASIVLKLGAIVVVGRIGA